MNSLKNKLNKLNHINNEIYEKYKDVVYNESGTIADIGYCIAYLDEIEGCIKTHFYGSCIIENMLNDNRDYYEIEENNINKINFYSIKNILDFNQKKMYELFKDINSKEKIPKHSQGFSCNNDNHGISNRILIYEEVGKKTYNCKRKSDEMIKRSNMQEMKKLYIELIKDINIIIDFSISFIAKLKNENKEKIINIFELKIKKLKKMDINTVIENSCVKNFKGINLMELKNKYDKVLSETVKKAFNNCLNEDYKLLIDIIFRVYEAIHLLNVNREVEKKGLNVYNEKNKFFFNDILTNTSINLLCSVYDKIGKELSNDSSNKTYFSNLKNNKIKCCYKSYDFISSNINDFDMVSNNSRELFEIKNTLLHYCIPGRILHPDDMNIYHIYKEKLVIYHSVVIEEILNFIIKFKK